MNGSGRVTHSAIRLALVITEFFMNQAMVFLFERSTTAGSLLRRLSLLPESDLGGACSPLCSSSQISPMAGASRVFTATSGTSDTSSALVHACFTGLMLVHFAVAFWTRTWLFRLILLSSSVGLLAYVVSSLQLVPGAIWLLRQIWVSINAALRNSNFFTLDESREYSPPLIPASLKAYLRWARKIECHVSVLCFNE